MWYLKRLVLYELPLDIFRACLPDSAHVWLFRAMASNALSPQRCITNGAYHSVYQQLQPVHTC